MTNKFVNLVVAFAVQQVTDINEILRKSSFRTSFVSLLSVGSFFSVGSTLSIASSFSLLSVGSHQSILSIGCNNRLLTICNWETYTVPDLYPSGGEVVINKVSKESVQCSNGDAAVYSSSPHSVDYTKYEICSVDEETPLTCTGDQADFSDAGLKVCLDADDVEKDKTLFVRRKDTSQVQSIAHMPPKYEYDRINNYNHNYIEFKEVTILFTDADAWTAVSTCTKKQKLNDDAICDWQKATCIFDNMGEQACEAKRKGHGSWQNIDKKPSFKIKWKEDHGYQYRLTFNNNVDEAVSEAQIKAYATFQDLGVDSPRASMTKFRFGPSADKLNAYRDYTQVEEVDEVEFLGARGLDGAAVYEFEYLNEHRPDQTAVDIGPLRYKLGPLKKEDASLMDLQRVFTDDATLAETWRVINQTQFFRWYAGLQATHHYDSGCMIGFFNNMYVMLPPLQERYIFIPWGTDRTMQCSGRARFYPSTISFCAPMQKCFANHQCSKEYFDVAGESPKLCGTENIFLIWNLLVLCSILGPVGVFRWRRYLTTSKSAAGNDATHNLLDPTSFF